MANTAKTIPATQLAALKPWKPGQSGNPAGRPKGSRNKLGEEFIATLYADFLDHGEAAIIKVREEHPAMYMKILALILPKELHIKESPLEDLSDNELIEYATAVRSFLTSQSGTPATRRNKPPKGKAGFGEPLN